MIIFLFIYLISIELVGFLNGILEIDSVIDELSIVRIFGGLLGLIDNIVVIIEIL